VLAHQTTAHLGETSVRFKAAIEPGRLSGAVLLAGVQPWHLFQTRRLKIYIVVI
jgi:hypothetical protein